MRNKITKIFAMILAFVMIFNLGVVSRTVAFANADELKTIETIYLDGIEYEISINNNLNLEVNTYIDGGEFSLEIDKFSGEGFFNTSDDDIDIDDFEVKINEIIDEDNLDIIIEEGDGNIENIDSVEDLIDEAYEGQMTLVAGTFAGLAGKAILSALIAAIAYAAKVIVVAGITYYAVDRVADKIKNGFIYRAYRANNAVYISPLSITKSQAIRLVRLGKDVYTLLKAHAKSIVASTGLGVTQSENHYYTSRKRGIYYSHFHTANRNGAHSFYGLPLIK